MTLSIRHRSFIILLAFVTLFSASGRMFAQEEDEPVPLDPETRMPTSDIYYGIGLNASLLSGAGLSGRVFLGDRYALQLTTFVIALNSLTHFNIGLEGQYTFTRGEVGRLYGLAGGGYYLTTKSDTTKPGNRIAEPVRLGLGVGGDLDLIGNLSMDGSLAFHWFVATGKVLPLPSIGFHYYFK